ncbi:hypothetical protein C2G38_2255839 [Gigaspora rosea]|uniref:Uncharacterized protein n=1 Tax=Gigaspora rosea TaxID=44941 RepID=A0A397TW03_9GLOM|nr:hypothetical protein C2G38_2255839 [Gigaspora rosea]
MAKTLEEWLEKAIFEGHINYIEYKKFTDPTTIGIRGFGKKFQAEDHHSCKKQIIVVNVFQGKREDPTENTPPQYIELYKRCWDNDPANLQTSQNSEKSLSHPNDPNALVNSLDITTKGVQESFKQGKLLKASEIIPKEIMENQTFDALHKVSQQVRFVLSLAVEWDYESKAIMRECVYNAGYLEHRQSENLVFITKRKLSVISELCGGSCVDCDFLKFLDQQLGFDALKKLKESHYEEFQYSKQMKESQWKIDLEFQDVKNMFDPVVKKVTDLIQSHCASTERRCATVFNKRV